MRGAEAILKNSKMLGRKIVIKERVPKKYRIPELDKKLRKERTRQEAKLLHRAKIAGVKCPTVLFVDEFSIGMTKINGKRPRMNPQEGRSAGQMLAKLHNANIIHGDFTPANLLENKEGLFVIDFGLGFFSDDIEDRAIDVLTMLKSIRKPDDLQRGLPQPKGSGFQPARCKTFGKCRKPHGFSHLGNGNKGHFPNEFLDGYGKISKEYEKIIRRVEEVKKRARYA